MGEFPMVVLELLIVERILTGTDASKGNGWFEKCRLEGIKLLYIPLSISTDGKAQGRLPRLECNTYPWSERCTHTLEYSSVSHTS